MADPLVRALAVGACVPASASTPLGLAAPAGTTSGNRAVPGKGTFPRWRALTIATEVPLRFIVRLPPHGLAALGLDSTLWVFELARSGLSVRGRFGNVASLEASLTAVRLDHERTGVALEAPVSKVDSNRNPMVADVDGDGLLDLAVADRRALHLFLSVR